MLFYKIPVVKKYLNNYITTNQHQKDIQLQLFLHTTLKEIYFLCNENRIKKKLLGE